MYNNGFVVSFVENRAKLVSEMYMEKRERERAGENSELNKSTPLAVQLEFPSRLPDCLSAVGELFV